MQWTPSSDDAPREPLADMTPCVSRTIESEIRKVAEFSERAEILRKTADAVSEGDLKAELLSLASEYQRLADLFEAGAHEAAPKTSTELLAASGDVRAAYMELAERWSALEIHLGNTKD